jgi:hypothetical protein
MRAPRPRLQAMALRSCRVDAWESDLGGGRPGISPMWPRSTSAGGGKGLGRKEKEKSERRQENLETLQTGSGAIAGIVVGGDATVGGMGRKGPGGL